MTTVEFALAVPVILLLFLGAIEMTRLNYLTHTAANAAYAGARKSIVAGGSGQDAQEEALRLLELTNVHHGAEIEVGEWPDRVQITVRLPVNLNSWGVTRFSSNLIITRSCTLAREQTGQP